MELSFVSNIVDKMFVRVKRGKRLNGRVDKVYVRRRTFYPLEPCGDGVSAVEEVAKSLRR